jgi:hypothetical protein
VRSFMIENNATLTAEVAGSYANIIGPIIGGCIAAGAGLLVMLYKEKITERKENEKLIQHQKIVAKALYEEISAYQSFFNRILTDYSTSKFDEAFNDIDHRGTLQHFEISAFSAIVNYGIVTSGPLGSFILEKNPFSTFYEDIYKFDNFEAIRKIFQFYQYLQIADKYYRNYCDVDRRVPTDLRRFLDSIEKANSFLDDEDLLTYLGTQFRGPVKK